MRVMLPPGPAPVTIPGGMRRQLANVLFNEQVRPSMWRLGLDFDWTREDVRPARFVMLSFPDRIDPLLPRPFSISDVWRDGSRPVLELLYKPIGAATRLMRSLQTGEAVNILGLLGNGYPAPREGKRPVLLAGGIGNAPFALLVRHLVREHPAPERIVLFLAGRSRDDVYIQDAVRSSRITIVEVTDDGSWGEKGLITQALSRRLESLGEIEAFACGPPPMLRALRALALERRFSCHLSVEEMMACGYGVCNACVISSNRDAGCYFKACTKGPVFEASEVVL
jgi:dihydroorotate dehydrogenase electron transfer subunit